MPSHDQKTAGRELRYRLTLVLLDHHRPMTLVDLLAALDQSGYDVAGRPSKTLSDALRWEVRRGRVRRLARSTYRTGSIPPSTVRWMRRWLETHRAWSEDLAVCAAL